ncbi:single-stranded DNA-binding protein [Yinghuangia sp. YIM S09857]|uniref:single-stranded DNA-binding protein n=1 Tax=Yinghuangia sp. YIM S09857 TaxID=3436929 RepID=UPI003F530394
MNDTYVTLIGNVVSEVRTSLTNTGVPMARFRLGVSPRRFDRDANQWVSRDSSFYTVVAWRRLAEHTMSSVEKGDPVVVAGRLSIREWQRDERWYTSVEVEAYSLGHDLTRGTSHFTRAPRRERDAGHTPGGRTESDSPRARAA